MLNLIVINWTLITYQIYATFLKTLVSHGPGAQLRRVPLSLHKAPLYGAKYCASRRNFEGNFCEILKFSSNSSLTFWESSIFPTGAGRWSDNRSFHFLSAISIFRPWTISWLTALRGNKMDFSPAFLSAIWKFTFWSLIKVSIDFSTDPSAGRNLPRLHCSVRFDGQFCECPVKM